MVNESPTINLVVSLFSNYLSHFGKWVSKTSFIPYYFYSSAAYIALSTNLFLKSPTKFSLVQSP